MRTSLIVVFVAFVAAVGGFFWQHNHSQKISNSKNTVHNTSNISKVDAAPPPAPKPSACASNTLDQNIIIGISKQHLWACNGSTTSYDSAVITGMQMYTADLTPTGTYHIYGKQTNQTLAGHDSTGSWSDFVNYWMPFLNNQYGTYGFHDLTQTANGANGRADSDFGNVDINAPYTAAKHASHGCVEMPLAAIKWLYNWSQVGTTVTIES